MKVLGFRSDPSAPRYALVDSATNPLSLVNAATESRLCFPADCTEDAAKVTWLYREFERVFHSYPDITRVVIKKGEFTQGDNNAKRVASYQEAALLLYCGLNNKPVFTKIYASLATNSSSVVAHALARVGQTTRYWNSKMADAVADYGIVGISTNGAPVQPSSWYVLHAAPETVAGNGIEARTDIFQTGLTLFRLLVGLGTLEAKFNSLGQTDYTDALAKGMLITRVDFPHFIPNAVCRTVMTAIDPDPAKRFQSALEMRRALEKLSFAGHWTVDATGELRGEDARNAYRFEQVLASGPNAYVSAFKTNKASGRETRISQFTNRNMTDLAAKRLVGSFLKAVVEGNAA